MQGCTFLGAGSVLASVPVTAGAPCSTWRGWGSSSLPRRVRGAQKGMQPAGDGEAPGSLWKASWNPVLRRGHTWALFSVGQGRDWCGALGELPGKQALVLQHQGRRQHLRPQGSCAQRWWGGTTHLGRTGWDPGAAIPCSWPSCVIRAVGDREGTPPRGGSQWFGDPVLLDS